MSQELYSILALGARYWFLLLLLLIVWCAYVWFRKDMQAWKNYVKAVPSTGMAGEIVVLRGDEKLPTGKQFILPREGLIGRSRICDIQLPSNSISKRQLYFRLDENKGLYLKNLHKSPILLDGQPLSKKANASYLFHGSKLEIGGYLLQFFFYSGFGVRFKTIDLGKLRAEQNTSLQSIDTANTQEFSSNFE